MRNSVGDTLFMKRVLIPFWVLRIIFMLADIVVYGLAIGVIAYLSNHSDLRKIYGASITIGAALAILCIVMLLVIACLAFDIVCIVKFARRSLTPRFFLIVNGLQTLLWTVLFIMAMVGPRSSLSIVFGVLIYLLFLGFLIYAIVIFVKIRKASPADHELLGGPQQSAYNAGYNAGYYHPNHLAVDETMGTSHASSYEEMRKPDHSQPYST